MVFRVDRAHAAAGFRRASNEMLRANVQSPLVRDPAAADVASASSVSSHSAACPR
jgi:hypothetical protein